jgi:RNAse (barnase) inhibitor barstar
MARNIQFPRSGVYLAPPDVQALRERAAQARIAWFELNLARVETKRQFFAACAKGLRLHEWFGGNWDALADCLKDLYADSMINCRNCEKMAEATPDDFATALEIFRDAADYWSERGSTFLALVDAEPHGATLTQLPA